MMVVKSCDDWLVEAFQARNHDLPELALEAFSNALRLEPDDDAIRLEMARSQFELGLLQEGRATMARLGNADTADEEFLLETGRVWMLAGHAEEAQACFAMVRESSPHFPQATLESTLLTERTIGHDHSFPHATHVSLPALRLREAIRAESRGDFSTAIELHERITTGIPQSNLELESSYRNARLKWKQGDVAGAFATIRRCKQAESKTLPVDRLAAAVRDRRAYEREMMNRLPVGWFADRGKPGTSDHLMLLGHARSGTSLLAKRMAEACDANWIDESPVFDVLARRWLQGKTQAAKPDGLLSLLGAQTRSEREQFQGSYRERLASYAGASAASRWIDKNPGLSASLIALHRLLPDVGWIMTLRDPRDIALSCYFQRFGATQLGWACQTPEGTRAAILHTLDLWLKVQQQLPDDGCLVVRYEDFVRDETTLDRICTRLGWHSHDSSQATASAPKGPAVNQTPSYADVRRPVYTHAVGRWQETHTFFQPKEEPAWSRLIEQMGYNRK